jgi:TonB family protein
MVSMGVSWGSKFVAAVGLSLLALSSVSAQATSIEDSKRKVKFKTNPQYSELARRMSLNGKVKIEVVIAPDGHVKSSRAVGGHPLLVQSCLDAVKDWRFEPASEETTQIIEFEFKQ